MVRKYRRSCGCRVMFQVFVIVWACNTFTKVWNKENRRRDTLHATTKQKEIKLSRTVEKFLKTAGPKVLTVPPETQQEHIYTGAAPTHQQQQGDFLTVTLPHRKMSFTLTGQLISSTAPRGLLFFWVFFPDIGSGPTCSITTTICN